MGCMAGMAGRPPSLEVPFAGNMTRMERKTLITQDAGAFVATVAESIGIAALLDAVSSGKIVHQKPLILGAMGSAGGIWIIAGMAICTLDDGNIIGCSFLFTIRAEQADYLQILTLILDRVERRVGLAEFHALISRLKR